MTRFLRSLKKATWRARAAWKMEASREHAEQLRIENPAEYQRILGLATDDGQRLAEHDPDGFVAFVLARSDRRGKD